MGPGLLEAVYQACLEQELRLREIPLKEQVRLPIVYKGTVVADELVMDVYFPGKRMVL